MSEGNEDTLNRLRIGVEGLLNEYVVQQKEEVNATQAGIVQCYILLQILDMLDNINEKLAMVNINIQDVEQEIAKLRGMNE